MNIKILIEDQIHTRNIKNVKHNNFWYQRLISLKNLFFYCRSGRVILTRFTVGDQTGGVRLTGRFCAIRLRLNPSCSLTLSYSEDPHGLVQNFTLISTRLPDSCLACARQTAGKFRSLHLYDFQILHSNIFLSNRWLYPNVWILHSLCNADNSFRFQSLRLKQFKRIGLHT